MIAVAEGRTSRLATVRGEARKIPAFIRRDFLVAWSYRMSFLSDIAGLAAQAFAFYFIGKLVPSSSLPKFDGTEVTYLEFAAVGIAVGVFIQLGLDRIGAATRNEQLMGTLESLLMTPTSPATIQLGSVAFDLVYIPLRTAIFLVAVGLGFGLDFQLDGLAPALLLLLAFIPFVWGVGVASAALVFTFKRGAGLIGLGTIGLALISGVYFPVEVLPDWLADAASVNPIALVLEGMREALLGGGGWSVIWDELALLAPVSLVCLVLGLLAFRAALWRERRRGTIGLY